MNLTCKADAEPQAEFTWIRNRKEIPYNDDKYEINTDANESVLSFMIGDRTDFGEYECVAKNNLGTLRRTITVREGVKPDPPTEITLRGKSAYILDINLGDPPITKADFMEVTGYRFEITPIDEFSTHEWSNARVIIKPHGSK